MDQKPRLKSTPYKIITKCHCNQSPARQTAPSSKDTPKTPNFKPSLRKEKEALRQQKPAYRRYHGANRL